MPVGISQKNVDPQSFLAITRDQIQFPIAANTTFFSSATSGGTSAAQSIASSVAGDVMNLSAHGQRPLPYARRLTFTKTDAASDTLRLTVQVIGRRFGNLVREVVEMVAEGTETVSSVYMYDEVTSVTIVSVTANTTSDTLSIGVDGLWLGLLKPIKSVRDVNSVFKIANGTPNAGGPKIKSEFTSALVDVRSGGINVHGLHSNTSIAVTDIYVINYFAHGEPEFVQRAGVLYA
jgi:hypothetical protein